MKNIICTLAYCGTHYFGFQKTKMGPSIQQELENALETILRHPVKIQGASRTDRGVHAEGQVINFFAAGTWDLRQLQDKMGALLPKDISPLELKWGADDFHPTLDTIGKEYHYHICNQSVQLPFYREFSWHFHSQLDLERMRQGAKTLEGKRDFSPFTSLKYADPVRQVNQIEIDQLPSNRLRIRVNGDNFLYKMVRTIVGTLVYVGCGKIQITDLSQIGERAEAGMTAPAHGLSLKKVFY
ncbi:MAG: tRNA pseudouridine(38-40) synthase TruA [Verrucomicrobia bacterium]|nr:tRNA pseudouridine(38-40) synthase TruA [Verrucomicrobiota bacterium]